MGDGSDLKIYHDESNSYITDSGSGNLLIGSDNDLWITNAAGNENKARFTTNGGVNLYYDNAKKFETTGAGVTVTGTVYADDFSTAGIATANEFRLNTWGVTSYTRMGGGQVLASGVNDKGSLQVGALTTCLLHGTCSF